VDNRSKQFVQTVVRSGRINNAGVGKVVGVGNDGRHTVRLDGGLMIRVFNASGQSFSVGDTVGLRFLGKDLRQAEITGKSTRRLAGKIKRVWR
jgi:hypothetical protein